MCVFSVKIMLRYILQSFSYTFFFVWVKIFLKNSSSKNIFQSEIYFYIYKKIDVLIKYIYYEVNKKSFFINIRFILLQVKGNKKKRFPRKNLMGSQQRRQRKYMIVNLWYNFSSHVIESDTHMLNNFHPKNKIHRNQ